MTDINRYIFSVTQHLPEKDREKVGRELKNTIINLLQGDYSKENVKLVLEDLGSPYNLSCLYFNQESYLIGPRIYEAYVKTLKILGVLIILVAGMAILRGILINLKTIDAAKTLADRREELVRVLSSGLSLVVKMALRFFFWITLGFVLLERSSILSKEKSTKDQKFRVENLREIPKKRDKIFSTEELVLTVVFTMTLLYGLLFRSEVIALYTIGEGSYPIFNAETLKSYGVLILGVGGLSVNLTLCKLRAGYLTKKLAIMTSIYLAILLMVTSIVILDSTLFNVAFLGYLDKNYFFLRRTIEGGGQGLKIGLILMMALFSMMKMGTSLHQGFRE